MALPGFDPEEGSQRFIPFLVGLLGFRFRAVTFMFEGCVFLVQNVHFYQKSKDRRGKGKTHTKVQRSDFRDSAKVNRLRQIGGEMV